MKKEKKTDCFRSISVKSEFASAIEKFIADNPQLGYRSIASFLEDSARRRLEDLRDRRPAGAARLPITVTE